MSWVREVPTLRRIQTKTNCHDEDLLIKYLSAKHDEFNYNLSDFFRNFDTMKASVPGIHEKIDNYIRTVDERVKIDTSDINHRTVIEEVKSIVLKICKEVELRLPKKRNPLRFSYWRSAGSSSANLRVGRPYELDVLVDAGLANQSDFDDVILPIIKTVVRSMPNDDFPDWCLEGVYEHGKGICFMFKQRKTVGVLVDVIPVTVLAKSFARSDISKSFERLITKYCTQEIDLSGYKLIGSYGMRAYDTGIMENQVLKALPLELKIALRVVKYLLQNRLALPALCVGSNRYAKWITGKLPTSEHLYGYVPAIRSYVMKCLFLHLISSTVGTEYEAKLTVPALTMCLLDMVMHTLSIDTGHLNHLPMLKVVVDRGVRHRVLVPSDKEHIKLVNHPRDDVPCAQYAVLSALAILSCKFLHDCMSDDVVGDDVPLVNRPNLLLCKAYELARLQPTHRGAGDGEQTVIYTTKLDDILKTQQPDIYALRLWGFCRGATADQILACCIRHRAAERQERITRKSGLRKGESTTDDATPTTPRKCRK